MAAKSSFSLGKNLEISSVAGVHERMQKALQKATTVELKADAVERIDSAGLQLVLSFKQELQQAGGELSWRRPSEKVLEVAQLLGMTEMLGL